MPKVWVCFGDGRDYPIYIHAHALRNLGVLVQKHVKGRRVALISHPRILHLYGEATLAALRSAGCTLHIFPVPEGEKSKNLQQAEKLMGYMIQKRMDRQSVIIAFGGGVVGDLAGFVAATFMRGIDLIQVPTTLLAQVDSSVGGKVAVNHKLGKNMIGAFLQPRLVVTDPSVLGTLTQRQFRAGLAEVIKSAIIADATFFEFLEKNLPQLMRHDFDSLSQAIAGSCRIKARIVEQDEREQGLRAILNYGHTVGHALETYHQYQGYLHGEAVAIGMVVAARLASEIGLCSLTTAERQIEIIQKAGLPIHGKGEKIINVLKNMKTDKKVRAGELNLILTPHIGRARIAQKISCFLVRRVLKTVLGGA